MWNSVRALGVANRVMLWLAGGSALMTATAAYFDGGPIAAGLGIASALIGIMSGLAGLRLGDLQGAEIDRTHAELRSGIDSATITATMGMGAHRNF